MYVLHFLFHRFLFHQNSVKFPFSYNPLYSTHMLINDDSIIIADELTKKFGSFTAVDNVSFSVRRGEIFGFLGANGAGKTTAMRMLCGLSRPTAGRAEVAGYDVGTQPEQVKRHIGYMSQRFSLYDDLTVAENMRLFGGIYGMDGKMIRRKTDECLHSLALEGERDTSAGSRSWLSPWQRSMSLE